MRKTPFSSSLRSWLAKLTTFSLALASFIMISTYMLHFTVASTFASNLSWFNCAVFLRQKLATFGQDVAPNRCFTIRYSSISFVRSPFGHHKNTFIFKKCHSLLGPPGIGKTLLLCQQLLMVFVQTFLHDHHPHLAGLQGMRYWVVREVPHWSIRCVQLFFRHSFCISSFYEVVHCRPIFPQQFFILRETRTPKTEHFALPLLLLSLYGRSCRQGKATWKCPSTCCRIPSIILRVLLSSTDGQTLVSISVF